MTAIFKQNFRTLAAATCALAILSGAAIAQDNKLIGAALADQKSLFYIAAGDGMKAAAEEAGLTLNLMSANNNANEQVSQIENLLVQQPGALLFISQDSTAAAAGVKAANAAGVPVIAVDQRPESGAGKIVTFIATDSVKAARDLCAVLRRWSRARLSGSRSCPHRPSGRTSRCTGRARP